MTVRRRVRNTGINKGTKVWGQVRDSLKELTEGVVLSIDPSCGSISSLPGFAVYRAGELVDSGVIELTLHKELPFRLRELHRFMHQLIDEVKPDVLVYEDVPPRHYGRQGRNDKGHASLLKSLGVVMSMPGVDKFVGLAPITWKRLVRDSYVKSDEADAVEMGYIAIQEAARIQASLPKRRSPKSVEVSGGCD